MNTSLVTGYLVKAAAVCYRPTGQRVLVFETMLQAGGDAAPTPWHCEIEDGAVIDAVGARLMPGQAVALRAELAGRPFMKGGVQAGFSRFLRVDRVECVRAQRPNTGGARTEAPEEGDHETHETHERENQK